MGEKSKKIRLFLNLMKTDFYHNYLQYLIYSVPDFSITRFKHQEKTNQKPRPKKSKTFLLHKTHSEIEMALNFY